MHLLDHGVLDLDDLPEADQTGLHGGGDLCLQLIRQDVYFFDFFKFFKFFLFFSINIPPTLELNIVLNVDRYFTKMKNSSMVIEFKHTNRNKHTNINKHTTVK